MATNSEAEVMMDNLYGLIHSFFLNMSAQQWVYLKSGSPDVDTKFKLAELLMNIVSKIAKSFLTAVQGFDVSEESVVATVSSTVPQMFAQVLKIEEEETATDSTKNLMNLVAQEVTECVKSNLSQEVVNKQSTCRLNEMVNTACRMIKDFLAKVFGKKMLRSSQRKRKGARSEDFQDSITSQDSVLMMTAEAVQEIILREVPEITEPLLGDLEDNTEHRLLQSEFQAVARDISLVIVRARRLEEVDNVSAAANFETVKIKIRTHFGKYIFKSLLHRGLAQIQTELGSELSPENSQGFLTSVESMIVPEGQKAGMEDMVFQRLKNISSPKNVKKLSDFLYMNSSLPSSSTAPVPQEPNDMYQRIEDRAQNIVKLMNWWLTSQADSHSERLSTLLMRLQFDGQREEPPEMAVEAVEEIFLPENFEPDNSQAENAAKEQMEFNKTYLEIMVEKLVSQIYSKTKIKTPMRSPEIMINKLFNTAWAEVEYVAASIPPQKFEKLVKAVFKDLYKKWGSADSILVSMSLQKPAFEEFIVSAFRIHLQKLK